jgi:hypothetical protein
MLYRSDSPDANDPQTAEALEVMRRDPDLAAWFEQHRSAQEAIRGKLKAIPVPPDLRRRILDAHVDHRRVVHLFGAPMLVGLAAAALIVITASFWISHSSDQQTFVHYRDRMARKVQRRVYFTSMVTGDQTQVSNYFRTNGAPTDEALPKNLVKLPLEGGAIVLWENHPVSVLCLDAREKGATENNDVWVFIAKRADMTKLPDKKSTQFEKIGGLMTASWTAGDTIYLVVSRGDRQDLQKYLE